MIIDNPEIYQVPTFTESAGGKSSASDPRYRSFDKYTFNHSVGSVNNASKSAVAGQIIEGTFDYEVIDDANKFDRCEYFWDGGREPRLVSSHIVNLEPVINGRKLRYVGPFDTEVRVFEYLPSDENDNSYTCLMNKLDYYLPTGSWFLSSEAWRSDQVER